MEDFEKKLSTMLDDGTPSDLIIKWVKEQHLASYKNGLAAGRKPRESKGAPADEVEGGRGRSQRSSARR